MEIMILIVIAYRECQTINMIRIGIEVGSYKPIIIIDTIDRSIHRYEMIIGIPIPGASSTIFIRIDDSEVLQGMRILEVFKIRQLNVGTEHITAALGRCAFLAR